jgi:undecaprenyl diphosphate synthase
LAGSLPPVSRCEQAGLDPARIPAHVAIIMDGNGRWARARGKDRLNAMRAEIEELIENRIRVRVSGRLHELPDALRREFEEAMGRTADFERMTFNLAINYGGRAEVVDAVRTLAARVRNGDLDPSAIDDETISAHLYSPDIPDPDLLIRTAGELRLSNFLLWETAYSEIYVTPTCWPDFDRDHLIAALSDYQKRVRRFGAIEEQS